MNNLEYRMTELRAEMEICKTTIRMQKKIAQIEKGQGDLLHARGLIRMFQNARKTLRFAAPKGGSLPINWKAWVREWNIYCYTHNKDKYTLYVHDNY